MFRNLSPELLGVAGSQSELIELAMSYGFRSIDLDVVEFAERVRQTGLPHARRLLDSAKIGIGTFALPVQLDEEDAAYRQKLTQLPELVSLAKDLGCARTTAIISPASEDKPYHQNFELHRQRLTEVARVLLATGTRLALGFDNSPAARQGKAFEFVHDLGALLVLLSTVGAGNLGLLLDVWQLKKSGTSPEDIRRKIKPDQIVAVYLADGPEGTAANDWPASERLLPGESVDSDCAATLVMLAEMGYDGPVTPAPHRSRFSAMRRDLIVKSTGEALDRVWKAAGLSPSGKLATAGTVVRG